MADGIKKKIRLMIDTSGRRGNEKGKEKSWGDSGIKK